MPDPATRVRRDRRDAQWPARPERRYETALQGLARRPDVPLALALNLPFCVTRCLCCDRDVRAGASGDTIDDYVSGLLDEMQALRRHLGYRHDVAHLHLGGGSASEVAGPQLTRLFDALRLHWRLPPDAEVSAHCDARRVDGHRLRLLRSLGVTHLVLGVMDLDADVQRAAGRSQSAELLDDVCTLARSCGLDCVQFDLMVGLPLQTPERWQRTLERLVQLGPDRVRLRHYRHRPRLMAGQATIDASTLPDRNACQALERQAARVLQDAGYGPLASDLFVLDDDSGWMAFEQGPARHAVRHGGQWPQLGLGVGAASRIDGRVFFSDARWDAWRDAVADGRLPVTHTRRLAWYTPGEARRDSSCPCDDHEDAARPRAAGVSGPLS